METEGPLLSTPINPNNFPAKLWHLVNDPHYQSICWNADGDGVIIDQQLFEPELLSAANEWFKTTNFTSFIRQLNLYGFRKLVPRSGSNVGLHPPGGDLGSGVSHQFCNEYFQKGRPDLLVNLKRLTSNNKAKMAAGLKINSRPPNRFQRLLTGSLTEGDKESYQGLMPAEQLHKTERRENVSPYPYVSPPSHSHIAFPGKQLACTPIPPRTWPSSFGLHQRQLASRSSFPERGIFYPDLQRFPADMTYTMSSTSTSVHVQQGHPALPRYTVLPCCTTPVHLPHLNSCSGPAVSSDQRCSYFQSPPMQPSFPMEFFNASWSSTDSAEFRRDEMNLESSFQFADEIQSSSPLDMVSKKPYLNLLVEVACKPEKFGKNKEKSS
ncbi:hypothetical protein GDO78_008681 [Eleutherodactylus coqui]|uniref:HSF-type DNA-binding domain-containing protein n=1 Tax=Eleutherodactylus coqui TaxID=57060 RepID=A0A8J6KB21_ELECQ|nr:hypothetical protein GDO78_008681 [Eleutherodactylus coqui]